MFSIVIAFLCLVASGASAGLVPLDTMSMPDGRIVGGSDADIREFPHQISMRYKGRHRCGGSIYSSNIIVSASHCVIGVDASLLSIAAGSTLLSKNYVEIPVHEYIMHSSYKEANNDYDVAILVLRGHLQFNEYIQPIALVRERPPGGIDVTVTGWGTLASKGDTPDQLQKVTLQLKDNASCRKSYSVMMTSRMLCAAAIGGGKDACQGDSGGPLVVGNKLLGIVSWGFGCGRKTFPGVYASVPDLADWIDAMAAAHTISFA